MQTPLRAPAIVVGIAGLLCAGHVAAHGAPPAIAAPPVVVAPQVYPGYVWQPGYWAWTGYGHTWIEGRWVIAAPPRPFHHGHPRGWERREWQRGPYGPPGGPHWGYR